jgi:hypothetical protein
MSIGEKPIPAVTYDRSTAKCPERWTRGVEAKTPIFLQLLFGHLAWLHFVQISAQIQEP